MQRSIPPPPGPRPIKCLLPCVRVAPTHGRTTLCRRPLEQSRGDPGVRYQPVEQVLAYLLSPFPLWLSAL